QGLDIHSVQHPYLQALRGQDLGGVQGRPGTHTGGDKGGVAALPQGDKLAVAEFGNLWVHGFLRPPADAHIHRASHIQGGPQQAANGVAVGGGHHRHLAHGPGDGQVFHRVVGGAVKAHGNSRVVGEDAHLHTGVGQIGAQLFGAQQGGEGGKGGDIGCKPAGGQAGGHRHHVLLGAAGVDEALGKAVLEVHQAVGGGQVGGEYDDIRALFRQGFQFVAHGQGGELGQRGLDIPAGGVQEIGRAHV